MKMFSCSRRSFLGLAAVAAAGALGSDRAETASLQTRGVVLYPSDLSLKDWPERAARAGLTTIGLHTAKKLETVTRFVTSEEGRQFLEQCRQLGLQVEYELHAMGDLLPRALFAKEPASFRLDEKGNRNPDSNCCPHATAALDTIAENAVRYAHLLAPTTHRYFYWPDDGQPWCQCAQCKGLLPSEQALLVENHMVQALRRVDARASLAHLVYANTLQAPRQVRPEPGIFLEFAPITRDYAAPGWFQEMKESAEVLVEER